MADSSTKDGLPVDTDRDSWLSDIKQAEREFDDWQKQCDTIKKKYTAEGAKKRTKRKYAMLWANTEVMKPSVYARTPSPSVTSRFKSSDPVTRISATLLERAITFQFDACDYDSTLKSVRDDYLLNARGVPRLRYEPTFKKAEIQDGESGEDATGDPDGEEDASEGEAAPAEEIDFEVVKCDFVNRRDFIHPFARRWEELPWLCYRAFLTRAEMVKRWPEIGELIELDAKDDTNEDGARRSKSSRESEATKGTVYEIWNKAETEVIWISPGYPQIIERGEPYLKLDGFFPSPKPAYGTLATDSLIPTPDYVQYQDQAEEIDDLTARIGSLTDSLKVVGFYPAGPQGQGSPEIEKAAQPGVENRLIAVKSWDSFKSAGGGSAPIVWYPVEMVSKIIEACVKLRKELVDDVFQITGIADIMRGDTDAEETASAQGLKAQWGNIRLRERQKELARVARDLTRMTAEIIANHFQISTLCKVADTPLPTEADVQQKAAEFQLQLSQYRQAQAMAQQPQAAPPMGHNGGPPMSPPGQQPAPATQMPQGGPGPAPAPMAPPQPGPPPGGAPAAPQGPSPVPPQWIDPGPTQEAVEALLRDNISRRFAIDIETDSTIAADEIADQKRRTEFIAESGKFITGMLPVIQEEPAAAEFIGALFMFGLKSFPVARELEDAAEKMIDKLMAAAGQPKPPSPEDLKAKVEMQKAQIGMQTEKMRAQAEIQRAQMDSQSAQIEHRMNLQQHALDAEQAERDHAHNMAQTEAKSRTLAQTVQIQEQRNAAKAAVSMFNPGKASK